MFSTPGSVSFPEMNASKYLQINQERYEVIREFQNQINHITKDTYQDTIKYVEKNSDYFFKDHDSCTLFLRILNYFSFYNFKQLELILDIGIYFSNEIKRCNITEYDIIRCSTLVSNNYLFMKNVISIETIFNYSRNSDLIFINFYPEIERYDKNYAKRKGELITKFSNDSDLIDFFNSIKLNRIQHYANRKACYHPSSLHKAIRDDDIDEFQSYLYKNNIDVNYKIKFSYYERIASTEKDLSLLQNAAIYGSLKIFKFLWFQNDIEINDNLQFYAYLGRNHEIIHICEQKCPFNSVIEYAIMTHQNDLVEYYIDNFDDKLSEDDEEIKEILKNFDDDENEFKKLSLQTLKNALKSLNYQIILACLPKIVYIIENLQKKSSILSLLSCCMNDIELFKFIFSHQNMKPEIIDAHGSIKYNLAAIEHNFTAVKLVIKNESFDYLFKLFTKFISENQMMLNLILDMYLLPGYEEFLLFCKQNMTEKIFLKVLMCCNENIIAKIVKLFGLLDTDSYMNSFRTGLEFFSKKMVNSLVKQLSLLYSKDFMANLAKRCIYNECCRFYNAIHSNLSNANSLLF